jgi:putative FmdB family regulatory protein
MRMPMYEYNCRKCGKTFEKLIKVSDMDKKVECPDCKSSDVRRVFSVFGVGGSTSSKGTGTLPCGADRSHGPACGGG